MIRERVSKINYYLDIAEAVSERGTCLRRNYGAIIVNNDEIISTGYVGAPRGRKNCSDLGKCMRMELNIPRGEDMKFVAAFTPRQMRLSPHREAKCLGEHFISAARK